jgi:hypothetical protein
MIGQAHGIRQQKLMSMIKRQGMGRASIACRAGLVPLGWTMMTPKNQAPGKRKPPNFTRRTIVAGVPEAKMMLVKAGNPRQHSSKRTVQRRSMAYAYHAQAVGTI